MSVVDVDSSDSESGDQSPLPAPSDHAMLHNLKLAITGRAFSSWTPFIKLAEDNGATILTEFKIYCLHLIFLSLVPPNETDPATFQIEKVQAAWKAKNIKVVWQEWLEGLWVLHPGLAILTRPPQTVPGLRAPWLARLRKAHPPRCPEPTSPRRASPTGPLLRFVSRQPAGSGILNTHRPLLNAFLNGSQRGIGKITSGKDEMMAKELGRCHIKQMN
ncbi:uncharacterized protein PGTG_13316 [Puccinia graminis f. sp. tritici CRL 75-36-700-3]|uniref:BRCT domain-containing protein n=1 Tax=Puccinia graminis f. sp. tritici (strain CRL 75-36-700-3 / race SCCL) TaxID=418459 RepID=E3KS22_PUCGT|nr:uncharacterized protein PGTG_13316 [Puccinia graminis f. sp. tritici CRL 75-36-700-3]EFP87097.1 hypothetical protein PGTG_13316 [Puccinia graminis f. sp. tritici CRL 75-36-700-3]